MRTKLPRATANQLAAAVGTLARLSMAMDDLAATLQDLAWCHRLLLPHVQRVEQWAAEVEGQCDQILDALPPARLRGKRGRPRKGCRATNDYVFPACDKVFVHEADDDD
jgi:hypothetical protein